MIRFSQYLVEHNKEKEILDLWAKNMDVEDIIKTVKGIDKTFIKRVIKKNGRKGWETI